MLNKKLNIFFIVILLFLNLNTSIHAQNIRVKIYSDINEIKNVSIYVNTGTYAIIATKDTIDKIEPGIPIFLCLKKNIIELKIKNNIIGCFNEISLMGLSLKNSFIIKPNDNQKLKRIYEDNLVVTISKNSLFLINYIDIENYIAGVVEAEAGGCSENEEFFKVQAIISRTYAISHINNHKTENFNLCDLEHCQVYKGKASKIAILKATYSTRGSVLSDDEGNLIVAAYHSNSGGLTVNSGDLWNKQLPYLISVVDSFSIKGSNATWEKTMKASEWLNFLNKEFNYPISDSNSRNHALTFSQDSCRLVFFSKNIPLRQIREKLKLRSTWFSVSYNKNNDEVILKGRGYGHGVGLSQQGAIIMANIGYSYIDILNFYYRNIKIIKKENLITNTPQ